MGIFAFIAALVAAVLDMGTAAAHAADYDTGC
jgi:hypothetical protein